MRRSTDLLAGLGLAVQLCRDLRSSFKLWSRSVTMKRSSPREKFRAWVGTMRWEGWDEWDEMS